MAGLKEDKACGEGWATVSDERLSYYYLKTPLRWPLLHILYWRVIVTYMIPSF